MEITQVDILEQKLNRAFKIGFYFQCIAVLALLLLMYFEPVGYKKFGLVLSVTAFLSSIYISKSYSEAEKELERSRMARPRSPGRKFNERFLLIYFPYTCWCPIIGVFLG
ncbi:MAG: hypothetical protein NTX49_01660 [Chlamydiae bacterium]|nr:hypothetical protein [Chlamydiota bacterium]